MFYSIIKSCMSLIENNVPFVLVTIIERSGSAPRSVGTNMIVVKNDIAFGSIGGGLIEATVMKIVDKVIASNRPFILSMDLSNESICSESMICGGHVSLLLDPILPKKDLYHLFKFLIQELKNHRMCYISRIFEVDKCSIKRVKIFMSYKNREIKTNFFFDVNKIKQIICAKWQSSILKVVSLDNKLVICSLFLMPKIVYIIGAGHIAQFVSRMASMVGFDVIVMDDRDIYANFIRFPDASKIEIIDFSSVFLKNISPGVFVVIVTRGHLYDKIVLEQAMKISAKYIGMIGSRVKIEKIFNDLRKNGISEREINNVYSPVGLDIGSETPEEIALSIVAEMVSVRSVGFKNKN